MDAVLTKEFIVAVFTVALIVVGVVAFLRNFLPIKMSTEGQKLWDECVEEAFEKFQNTDDLRKMINESCGGLRLDLMSEALGRYKDLLEAQPQSNTRTEKLQIIERSKIFRKVQL